MQPVSHVSIDPSPGFRRRASLSPPGLFPFLLHRLTDSELYLLAPYLATIKLKPFATVRLAESQRPGTLAKVFLGAEFLFGRSSSRFDPFKCSFSFPLLLTATRRDVTFRYVFVVRDLRRIVGFDVHRLERRRRALLSRGRRPVASEMSDDEIEVLTDALIDFLSDVGTALLPNAPPFYRTADGFTIYGCRSGEVFERELKTKREYDRVLDKIAREIDKAHRQRERDDIATLLQDISRGEYRQR